MAEPGTILALAGPVRVRILVGLLLLLLIGAGIWWWLAPGRESTDDAQVDAHVTPIAARVGGTLVSINVVENQAVDAGTVLLEIDPRDYQVAVEKARAELADAEASASAAASDVPITSTTADTNVTSARGLVDQAHNASAAAAREVEAARARLVAAEARRRETEANAARASKDVERLRGLLAKDEVSHQQFDAAAASADAQRAALDTARAQIAEAEVGIRVAESRQAEATAREIQAQAALKRAQTAPEQTAAVRARAEAARARADQARALLKQAELNLEHTVVKAPARGVVSRRSVNPGQVVMVGQPLLALVQTADVWVTANFKETQLHNMRPGQRATLTVDAYGGLTFSGRVDSIAAATGARFSVLPPENATGNFVKVVQRVPVKIVLDGAQDAEHPLRPGMSVTPTVYTR